MNLGSYLPNSYPRLKRHTKARIKLDVIILYALLSSLGSYASINHRPDETSTRHDGATLQAKFHPLVHKRDILEISTRSIRISVPTTDLVTNSPGDEQLPNESNIKTIFGKHVIELKNRSNKSDSIDASFCDISSTNRKRLTINRDKLRHFPRTEKVLERKLSCYQIDDLDYHDLDKSLTKDDAFMIHQIHIVASEANFVLTAIDLICYKFNCSSLTVLNISGHSIHDYHGLAVRLSSWPNMEVLDLTNSSLKALRTILQSDSNKPTNLRHLSHLYLNSNRLTELDFDLIFDRAPSLRHLSLVNNSILNIQCNESLRSRLIRQFDYINLSGNVINCNRTTQMWLLKLLQNPWTNNIFIDNDKINCTLFNLNEMTWSQRISVLETKICDTCSCHSAKKTAIEVDCSNKSLTALPDVLPLNTRILNLTMNKITSLGVPENAKNWENVTYVHLEDNLISSFQQLELNSKFIRNLVALDIRRNRFQEFPSHILEQFVNLDQVHLSNNPWLCDCESTFAFQEWLQRQFHKVGDKEEIRCGTPGSEANGLKSNSLQQRLSSRVIYKLSKTELCPQDNVVEPFDWLDVVNLILGFTIVLILAKVVMDYIYQHRTKRLPHFFKINI